MATVLNRTSQEVTTRLPEQLLEELSRRKLSQIMRRQTWPDHERAEYSAFEQALVNATLSREAYADRLAQVHLIYAALEDRAEEMRSDPVAGPVIFPELHRKDAVEADLRFYLGSDWRAKTEILPVTLAYAKRIRGATPAQFV